MANRAQSACRCVYACVSHAFVCVWTTSAETIMPFISPGKGVRASAQLKQNGTVSPSAALIEYPHSLPFTRKLTLWKYSATLMGLEVFNKVFRRGFSPHGPTTLTGQVHWGMKEESVKEGEGSELLQPPHRAPLSTVVNLIDIPLSRARNAADPGVCCLPKKHFLINS